MRHATKRSLAIDDLVPGRWYEFRFRGNYVYFGQWLGMSGHIAGLSIAPGTWSLFPDGTMLVRPVSWFASCRRIREIDPVVEPDIERLREQYDAMDVAEEQQEPAVDVKGTSGWVSVACWLAILGVGALAWVLRR